MKNPAQIASAAVISALWPVAEGVNKKSEKRKRERKRRLKKTKKHRESQQREGRAERG